MVRAGHRGRAAAQGRPAPHGDLRRAGQRQPQVARPGGDRRRGHPQPRRPPHRPRHRARLAGRRARSRSGASTSTCAAGPTRWRPRACRSTGTCTATASATRCCRGRTSRPGCTRTSSGTTGRPRWPRAASPTAAGPRATTAGCAPATASSTSWRRRSRRPAAARAPGRTSARGGERPVVLLERRPMKLRLRYAKLGKVRFTSHRDTARVWERAMRRAGVPVAVSAGFTPRPRLSFGLALPTGAESVAEYLDLEVVGTTTRTGPASCGTCSTGCCSGSTTCCRSGSPRWPSPRGTRGGLAAGGRQLGHMGAVGPARASRRRRRRGGGAGAGGRRARRSSGSARASGGSTTCDPRSDRWPSAGDGTLVADVATVGRGLRPAELAAVTFPDIAAPTSRRCGRCARINGSGTTRTGAR